MQPTSAQFSGDETLSLVVTDHWLDEFCEQVGSLCAVLQALARIPGNDRPHTLVREALENCATLQDLLNHIPVWGGYVTTSVAAPPQTDERISMPRDQESLVGPQGDSFPEFAADGEAGLPVIDTWALEESCGPDIARMICRVRNFRDRAEGDLRQLELLSVGHEWTRLSRLAGMLKTSAAQVSAARIVVDAAALQGAARVGCRNDVDLALEALKADLHACSQQVEEWLTTGVVA